MNRWNKNQYKTKPEIELRSKDGICGDIDSTVVGSIDDTKQF